MKIKTPLAYRFDNHFGWCLKNEKTIYYKIPFPSNGQDGKFHCLKFNCECKAINCKEMHKRNATENSVDSFWNKKI